ncbi:hypothetical protein D8674_004431 [Pyrus ussuriensis x Pyrus communis]|uniref:Uncharacterized protein n=1 Tax=Pyrus ussuriensis x Pyrus communis TaxID=2448454 RepID=A0A5N5FJW4_9ROSA|nr:hypothetical protein D8674_004431 [Pyrus ussuriensis x Pyrus communis]
MVKHPTLSNSKTVMANKSKIYFAMDLVRYIELFPTAHLHHRYRDLKMSPRFWTLPGYSIADNPLTAAAKSKQSITIMAIFNMPWNLLEGGLRIWIAIIDGYASKRGCGFGEGDNYGRETVEG